MPLVKKVTRYGNSAGVILDQPILKQVGWEAGTEVEVHVVNGDRIVLTQHHSATDEEFRASAGRMFRRHRKSLERLK